MKTIWLVFRIGIFSSYGRIEQAAWNRKQCRFSFQYAITNIHSKNEFLVVNILYDFGFTTYLQILFGFLLFIVAFFSLIMPYYTDSFCINRCVVSSTMQFFQIFQIVYIVLLRCSHRDLKCGGFYFFYLLSFWLTIPVRILPFLSQMVDVDTSMTVSQLPSVPFGMTNFICIHRNPAPTHGVMSAFAVLMLLM